MSKKEEKLKDCPFCGSEAILTHESMVGSDSLDEFYRIECTNEDCAMGNPDCLSDDKSIIEDWNTRASKWVHVDIDMPEYEKTVYVYTEDCCHTLGYWDGCDWFDFIDHELLLDVEYWHELPDAPEGMR
jgi:hypothetical protein